MDEIAQVQLGKMLSQKSKTGIGARPYLRNINVRWGCIDTDDMLQMDFSEREAAKFALRDGDVLVCEGGEPGRAAVWQNQMPGALYQKALHRVRAPAEVVVPQYLAFHLLHDAQRGRLVSHFTGSTIKHFTRIALLRYRVRLTPLPEQHRIVAEIEKHFTRLDAAVAALQRVRANLKRYRAAVLKAACEGRLVPTEAELARAEGCDYEPADQLLARILKERRARWEADQLAKMQAKGKVPKDDKWKEKYEDPAVPDTEELPQLSEGWAWARLSAVADLKGGLTKGQKREQGTHLRSVPYLRVANVQRGYLDLHEVKEIEATEQEIKELRLAPGDILFNEGGDRDKLGRGWVWRGEVRECIHQNHVFRARLFLPEIEPRFISWFGNSFGQRYFMDEGKQTTNLASINLTKLSAFPIPVPSLAEQHRIVAEVERRLSVIDELDAVVDANLKRAERLRQAILKRAFEGKLVPQDPDDEPASVLLERIRAERALATSGNSGGRGSHRATTDRVAKRGQRVQDHSTSSGARGE